jgi:hypothetical protein
MAEDYLDFIADAQEMIAEFGQQCYWQKPAPKSGGTPGYPGSGSVPDPVAVKIAFFAPKDLDRGVQQFSDVIPGLEVADNTQVGLMAGGLSFTPENTDRIHRGTNNAEPISIIKIDLLAPNGTPVLWFVSVAA